MSGTLYAVVIVLGALAAVALYFLAWRVTRGKSMAMRAVVRGGLAVLIAVPLGLALVLPTFQSFKSIDTGLESAPKPSEYRLPAEDPDMADDRSAVEDDFSGFGEPIGEAPPAAANGEPVPQPMIIDPPYDAESEAFAPPVPSAPRSMMEDSAPAAAPDVSSGRSMAPRERAEVRAVDEPDADWDVVPVFYGTDRQQEPNASRIAYNAERGRRLELGRALVTVPKVHEVPQIERPWALRIPYFNVTIYEEEEDPKKHFTMREIRVLSKDEFLKLVRERIAGSNRYKDHALIFVHGYNTQFDHAVYRTAQISYDLKFDGAAFVYSWPSGGAVASYTYDRESAGAARPYLREFLDLVIKESGAKSISLIAHSMGNQPLLEVLKDMKAAAPDDVVINQVISAAPDVDADNFRNLAGRIEGFAKGVTLYAASNDRALTISRNFWQNPRAGDVPVGGPLIIPGIDTIDVTGASTDAFAINHSGYAENNDLLQDIGKLILLGLRPPDQRLQEHKRVTTDKGDYWRYTAP
jgi:esterase/lipase superfamily enzyme